MVAAGAHMLCEEWKARTCCTVILFTEMDVPHYSLIPKVGRADFYGDRVGQLLLCGFSNCPHRILPHFVFVQHIYVMCGSGL